jgi:peptidoglycan/LPS O-acetylase OafA/YrhL
MQLATAKSETKGLGYFAGVDGLRAIAVAAVILFHLNSRWLPGGFVGVDIFFVISGFVVTSSVAHLNFHKFSAFLEFFYARRIKRIYPALTASLLASAVLYILFVPKAWLSDSIEQVGISAFFGVSNFVLAFNTDSYFAPQASFNPFTHTWSLAVEEQFYLVFPFLMYAYQRWGREARWRLRLIGIIAVLCASSLVASALLERANWQYGFYLIPSRFWELGVGMLLCLTYETWLPLLQSSPARLLALGCTSITLIGISFATATNSGFPFPMAFLPVLGSAGLIATLVACQNRGISTPMNHRAIVLLGKMSYSLYLWHWPIFVIMRWTVGLSSLPTYAAALMATLIASLPSYYWIELPLRSRAIFRRVSQKTLIFGGIASVLLLAACTQFGFEHKGKFSLSKTKEANAWYPDGSHALVNLAGCALDVSHHYVEEAWVEVFAPMGCRRPSTRGRVYVAGDSHATAYSRVLRRYALETGYTIWIYTIPGCSFLPIAKKTEVRCAKSSRAITADIANRLQPFDIVFLPSLRLDRYQDEGADSNNQDIQNAAPHPSGSGVEEAAIALRSFSNKHAVVILEAPTPLFKAPPFRCSDWFNAMNPVCAPGLSVSRPEIEARRRTVVEEMNTLKNAIPHVTIWDPLPYLCPTQTCNAFEHGKPLFFDGDHLSGYGNDVLFPAFKITLNASQRGL